QAGPREQRPRVARGGEPGGDLRQLHPLLQGGAGGHVRVVGGQAGGLRLEQVLRHAPSLSSAAAGSGGVRRLWSPQDQLSPGSSGSTCTPLSPGLPSWEHRWKVHVMIDVGTSTSGLLVTITGDLDLAT